MAQLTALPTKERTKSHSFPNKNLASSNSKKLSDLFARDSQIHKQLERSVKPAIEALKKPESTRTVEDKQLISAYFRTEATLFQLLYEKIGNCVNVHPLIRSVLSPCLKIKTIPLPMAASPLQAAIETISTNITKDVDCFSQFHDLKVSFSSIEHFITSLTPEYAEALAYPLVIGKFMGGRTLKEFARHIQILHDTTKIKDLMQPFKSIVLDSEKLHALFGQLSQLYTDNLTSNKSL